jgi:protein-S-isoprenylcysteine O-methyltransferase Ste14
MQPRVPPPILLLLAGAVMAALDRWLPLLSLVPAPWRRLGAPVALLGVATGVAAFRHFRRARTTINPLDPGQASSLVTGGVFRLSRNPMYLGLTLVLLGWALWLGSLSPWAVPPLFVALITLVQILPEERALTRLFGARYLEYRGAVPRWLGVPAARRGDAPR